jgi:hypothetical protein
MTAAPQTPTAGPTARPPTGFRALPMPKVAHTVRAARELLKASPAAADEDVARVVGILEDLLAKIEKPGAAPPQPAVANPPAATGAIGPGGLGYLMGLSQKEEEVIEWGAHDTT